MGIGGRMSEIEKMYENAKVKPVCDGLDCFTCTAKCNNGKYPEFTAEKQLELIKWLVQNKRLCLRKAEYSNNFYMDTIINRSNGTDSINFEVCLASQVNNLWQDLTEEEKTEIERILEGD